MSDCCTDGCHAVPRPSRELLWLQAVTLCWMVIECSVALASAWRAHSAALLAFGADSLVELLSAAVVLLQYSPRFAISRMRAAKVAGVLLLALAAIVCIGSIRALLGHGEAEASLPGIVISVAALVAMPVLAWAKRREAVRSGDRALKADAAQSATCAWLAFVTLAGLAANALLHWAWMDSVAALVAVPLLVKEAREALRGELCECG